MFNFVLNLEFIFRKYLPCPKNVPLNEVLFYHGSNDITHRLCGSHRGALQTALSKPHLYMVCAINILLILLS